MILSPINQSKVTFSQFEHLGIQIVVTLNKKEKKQYMLSTPITKQKKRPKKGIDHNLLNLGGSTLLTEKILNPKKG